MVNLILLGAIFAAVLIVTSLYVLNSYTISVNTADQKVQPPQNKINEATIQKGGKVPQKIGSVDVVAGGVSETDITVNK